MEKSWIFKKKIDLIFFLAGHVLLIFYRKRNEAKIWKEKRICSLLYIFSLIKTDLLYVSHVYYNDFPLLKKENNSMFSMFNPQNNMKEKKCSSAFFLWNTLKTRSCGVMGDDEKILFVDNCKFYYLHTHKKITARDGKYFMCLGGCFELLEWFLMDQF